MKHSPWLLRISRLGIAASIIIFFLFTIHGCKKDRLPDTVMKADSLLSLTFSNNTIPLNLVDSGYIGLQKKGSATPYLLRFQKAGNEMLINIDGFKGEYTADIILHTRVDGSNHRREYYRQMNLQIGNNNGKIFIDAPKGTWNEDWKPRVILSYNNELHFYVSLDQSEPYFRVAVADRNKWKKFVVSRSANNKIPGTGTELISSHSWTCTSNCFVNMNLLENSQAFVEHANRLKNKTWNFGEIEILAETNAGIKTEDYYFYNR